MFEWQKGMLDKFLIEVAIDNFNSPIIIAIELTYLIKNFVK